MKIFKKYQTKRQIREENIRLKALLMHPQPIHTVERDLQKVQSNINVPFCERNISEEYIKNEIAYNMIKFLKPLIEYDYLDDDNGGKIYSGSLYVAYRQ